MFGMQRIIIRYFERTGYQSRLFEGGVGRGGLGREIRMEERRQVEGVGDSVNNDGRNDDDDGRCGGGGYHIMASVGADVLVKIRMCRK